MSPGTQEALFGFTLLGDLQRTLVLTADMLSKEKYQKTRAGFIKAFSGFYFCLILLCENIFLITFHFLIQG